MPTTNSENAPTATKPPHRSRRLALVIAGLLTLITAAAIIALLATSSSVPDTPTTAGPDVCTTQTIAEFQFDDRAIDPDEVARTAESVVATLPGVAATTMVPREEIFRAAKAALEQSKTPELAKLLRVEAFPAQVWVLVSGDQPVDEIPRLQQHRAHRIWVENPCRPSTAAPTP